MEVTRVTFRKVFNEKKTSMRAIVSVQLDNMLELNSLRVVEDKKGNLFVSYPNQKQKINGREVFITISRPLTKESKEMIETAVVKAYSEEIEKYQSMVSDLANSYKEAKEKKIGKAVKAEKVNSQTISEEA